MYGKFRNLEKWSRLIYAVNQVTWSMLIASMHKVIPACWKGVWKAENDAKTSVLEAKNT